MNETGNIIFDPFLPWPVIFIAIAVAIGFVGFAIWRGLSGWWLRGAALAVLLLAITNPSLQVEDREALSDIVILVVDESASNGIDVRPEQIAEAVADVEASLANMANTELRVVRLGDGADNQGTLLMDAVTNAMAEEPRARLAGVIMLTDGQLHDIERSPEMPAPLHALLTGEEDDWDRRLIVRNAPAFAIIGEPVMLTLRIKIRAKCRATPQRLRLKSP